MKAWIEKTTKQYLDRVFEDRFAEMLLKARLDLRRAEVIGEEHNEMTLGAGAEYILLETRTEVGETVEAWFDLSEMIEGSQVEFSIFARVYDDEWRRWERVERKGEQQNPAIHLSPMMFPRGAKIVVKLITGPTLGLRWDIRRMT